jgi:hypothetical protein
MDHLTHSFGENERTVNYFSFINGQAMLETESNSLPTVIPQMSDTPFTLQEFKQPPVSFEDVTALNTSCENSEFIGPLNETFSQQNLCNEAVDSNNSTYTCYQEASVEEEVKKSQPKPEQLSAHRVSKRAAKAESKA